MIKLPSIPGKWVRRGIVFVGFAMLSGGFALQSFKGELTAESYITYPLGVVVLYFPRLAEKLLKIWRGGSEGGQ